MTTRPIIVWNPPLDSRGVILLATLTFDVALFKGVLWLMGA